MKIAFIFLSFFLLVSCSLGAAPTPVVDTMGKNLRAGIGYYIWPVPIEGGVPGGRGGGLTLAATRNKTCPLDVVQELYGYETGLPVIFSPVNLKKGVIRESTDMNIKFSGTTSCFHHSSVWKLDNYDKLRKQYFLSSGGVEGNPGPQTTSNWFKIETYIDDYKLVFCPTVCKSCKVICKNVGIFMENGRRVLALSDVPLRVMFLKA